MKERKFLNRITLLIFTISLHINGYAQYEIIVNNTNEIVTFHDGSRPVAIVKKCFEFDQTNACSTPDEISDKQVIRIYNDLFNPACVLHDFGYRSVNWSQVGVSNGKEIADDVFFDEMTKICYQKFKSDPLEIIACRSMAQVYYEAVARTPTGLKSFNNGQARTDHCRPLSQKKYSMTIQTADESGAGTDSNISIKLHGANGSTHFVHLNRHMSGDVFERNDLDRALLGSFADLGHITSIEIRHDGKYAGAGWKFAWLQVNDGKTWWTFYHHHEIDDETIKVNLAKFTTK